VSVRVPEPVPEIYDFLPGYEDVNTHLGDDSPDLVVVMDASNLERLADVLGPVGDATRIVNIDHHVSNDRFGDVNLVVAEASSTAEVTYDLLRELGVDISPDVATNLYAGVLTDTGGFRHENTSYRALNIAAELVALGADPAFIAEMVYKRHKIAGLKLQVLTMATIAFECDDRLVHAEVTQSMLQRAGAQMEESEGLIDLLQSVEGLELALLFRELASGLTKISVRSRGAANANELAQVFGGGGHARAAGAELRLPLPQAKEAVLAQARQMLERTAA
jgi:phosphoesterase RecJ-like protein